MGLMSIFRKPVERRDFDASDIPTEICIYVPSEEFAEPGMDIPVMPVAQVERTSDVGKPNVNRTESVDWTLQTR